MLLDFSRIEAGRIEAVYEPVDLAAFTADLASVFRSAIERAGLTLIVDCPTVHETVYVDREMWEKIVLNLVSNALKFTFEGRIQVTLRQGAVGGRRHVAASMALGLDLSRTLDAFTHRPARLAVSGRLERRDFDRGHGLAHLGSGDRCSPRAAHSLD